MFYYVGILMCCRLFNRFCYVYNNVGYKKVLIRVSFIGWKVVNDLMMSLVYYYFRRVWRMIFFFFKIISI